MDPANSLYKSASLFPPFPSPSPPTANSLPFPHVDWIFVRRTVSSGERTLFLSFRSIRATLVLDRFRGTIFRLRLVPGVFYPPLPLPVSVSIAVFPSRVCFSPRLAPSDIPRIVSPRFNRRTSFRRPRLYRQPPSPSVSSAAPCPVVVFVPLSHALFHLARSVRFTPISSTFSTSPSRFEASRISVPPVTPSRPSLHCHCPPFRRAVVRLDNGDRLSSTSFFAARLLPSIPVSPSSSVTPLKPPSPLFHLLVLSLSHCFSLPPTNSHTPSAVVKRRFRADWSCALGMLRDNRVPSPLA